MIVSLAGGWPGAKDGPYAWGLCYNQELSPGDMFYTEDLHCLSLRLVTKWATDEKLREEVEAKLRSFAPKLTDTSLHHFCVFSDNVLGASVVINYASSKGGAEVVVAAITAAGGKAVAVGGDVRCPGAFSRSAATPL